MYLQSSEHINEIMIQNTTTAAGYSNTPALEENVSATGSKERYVFPNVDMKN